MKQIIQPKALVLAGFAILSLNSLAASCGNFSGLAARGFISISGNGALEDRLFSYYLSTGFYNWPHNKDCLPYVELVDDHSTNPSWITPGARFWEIIEPDTSQLSTTYGSIQSATVIGVGGASVEYVIYDINLSDEGDILEIVGDVTLFMQGDINIRGYGSIVIQNGASLKIYSENDLFIAGDGVDNQSQIPENFIIYGTASAIQNSDGSYSSGQSIQVSGHHELLAAAIYAPNADVSVSTGTYGGDFAGAIACFNLSILTSGYYVNLDLAEVFPFGTPDSWNPFAGFNFGHQMADATREFSMSWDSTYAATYQIEHTSSLDLPFQEVSGAKFHGTGGAMTWSDRENTNSSQGFYRVSVKEYD